MVGGSNAMTVEVIIYSCIYVCCCIILFDLIYLSNAWYCEKVLPGRTAYLEKQIKKYIEDQTDVERIDKFIKRLHRRLKDLNWIFAYFHASMRIRKEYAKEPVQMLGFANLNITLFKELSVRYKRMKNESKAFFAYIVFELMPNSCEDELYLKIFNDLIKNLISFMHSKSVFVRCNAFRAIVKTGSVDYVYHSLTVINNNVHLRNGKFFSDYLLEFTGDTDELVNRILKSFFEFSSDMQVAIINYLRLLPPLGLKVRCYPVILKVLCSPKTNGEATIAAIRFFGKHKCDDAYEKLLEFLEVDNEDSMGFNYAAVAAGALRNYGSQRTIDALLKKLSSRDWYVRYNCADSLIYLKVDYEEIVSKSTDPFAKEMIIHRSEVYKLRKGETA